MTARLFRPSERRWIGPTLEQAEPLPVEHPPVGALNWQVVPCSLGAERDDILVVGERPHRLLDRCGPLHWATVRLAEIAYGYWEPDDAAWWLERHEVWSARAVDRVA